MKTIKGIILGILVFALIVGGYIFWQANKKVPDTATLESSATFRVDEIMGLPEENLEAMAGKIIDITGIVLANQTDEFSSTITLGANEMEVVVCQMDNRHLENTDKLTAGHFVKLKGKVTGHDFDELMGKTVQMKNCVLSK